MNFGSICAGIGGGCLGLERAGFECAWQIEIDDYCTSILEKHWPNVTRYRDVRTTDAATLQRVDLILATIPCQPHSLAGKRKGAEDPRDLWPDTRRIVAELKPTWFVLENPVGIRRTILPRIRADLEALGYEVADVELPACAVGAPHRRARVFVVAHSGRERVQRPTVDGGVPEAEGEGEGEEIQRQRGRDSASDGSTRMADDDCRRRESGGIAQSSRLESEDGSLADGCSEVRQLDDAEAGLVYAEVHGQRSTDVQADPVAEEERARSLSAGAGYRGFWSDAAWIVCDDGTGKKCTRRVKAKAGTLPEIHGMADGIPGRLVGLDEIEPLVVPHFKGRREQLKALGNAVVPQVVEFVARAILAAER